MYEWLVLVSANISYYPLGKSYDILYFVYYSGSLSLRKALPMRTAALYMYGPFCVYAFEIVCVHICICVGEYVCICACLLKVCKFVSLPSINLLT